MKGAASIGQPQASRRPLDETSTEALFQAGKMPTRSSVRKPQPFGSLGQARQLGDLHEEFDLSPTVHGGIVP